MLSVQECTGCVFMLIQKSYAQGHKFCIVGSNFIHQYSQCYYCLVIACVLGEIEVVAVLELAVLRHVRCL